MVDDVFAVELDEAAKAGSLSLRGAFFATGVDVVFCVLLDEAEAFLGVGLTVAAEDEACGAVLVVAAGGPFAPLDDMKSLQRNCGVCVCEFRHGKFIFRDGKCAFSAGKFVFSDGK